MNQQGELDLHEVEGRRWGVTVTERASTRAILGERNGPSLEREDMYSSDDHTEPSSPPPSGNRIRRGLMAGTIRLDARMYHLEGIQENICGTLAKLERRGEKQS